MNEAVGSAFSGGVRSPPGSQDGLTTGRVLSNELDAARFDPLLVKNVAKSAVKAIDNFLDRAEGLVGIHTFLLCYADSQPADQGHDFRWSLIIRRLLLLDSYQRQLNKSMRKLRPHCITSGLRSIASSLRTPRIYRMS